VRESEKHHISVAELRHIIRGCIETKIGQAEQVAMDIAYEFSGVLVRGNLSDLYVGVEQQDAQ
jgi:hypothetical protein